MGLVVGGLSDEQLTRAERIVRERLKDVLDTRGDTPIYNQASVSHKVVLDARASELRWVLREVLGVSEV